MMAETKSTKTASYVEIPREWEIITLKDACIKIQDGNYGGDYPKQDEFFESGIPFLTSKAIGGEGEIIDKKIDFISEEKHLQLKKAQLKLNDVLFTNRGANVGTIGLVDERIAHGNIGPQLTLLRANSARINFLFLKEVMKSHFVQNQVRSQDSGSAMNFFGIGDTSKFKIPLPPLPEQKAIAQVLSTADAAIHTTEKLIAQKELRKKWLMQQLLTGKKRLMGFGGEWKEKKLGKLFNQIKNVNDGADSHSIMTISSKLGLISQEDKFDRVIAGDSLKKYTQLVKGDFAYNKGNSKTYPMGCIYRLEEKESALVPFVYISFSPTDSVDGLFYKHWFLAHGLDRQLNKIITSGARGDGLLNVNTDDFFGLKIIFPPKEEQTAIAQVLQAADKEISLLKAKAEKLREQKKGLMQVLLTGKVRLKIN
jgi:type I restriction enzyme S subunit